MAGHSALSGQGPDPFRIPVHIQAVTGTSAVICWEWERPAACTLLYGPGNGYGNSVPVAAQALARVRLGSLTPGTRYYYNLVVKGKKVFTDPDQYIFYTAPADRRSPFTLAVLGDTRGGQDSFDNDHRAVVRSIRQHTFPDLILHTGDLVEAEAAGCWERFFRIQEQLLRQVPLYPARGRSDGNGDQLKSLFSLPDDQLWYAVSHGCLYVIALDIPSRRTEAQYQRLAGPDSPQYQWLLGRLTSAERRAHDFTLVFFHAPLYPPDGKASPYLRQHLAPLLEKYRVDLVCNGQHYFSYAQHNGVTYITSGGGGASLDRSQRVRAAEVLVYRPVFHHLRLQVHYPSLIIQAVDNLGTVFFNQALLSHQVEGGLIIPDKTDSLPFIEVFVTGECLECTRV
jgi:hypothetical protein